MACASDSRRPIFSSFLWRFCLSEPVRAMPAAALATEATFEKIFSREDHVGAVPIEVSAFDERRLRLVFGRAHGLISTGVPFGTSFQISSISASVTAMQPSVQSCSLCAAPTNAYLGGSP